MKKTIFTVLLATLALVSCRTTPPVITEKLTVAGYFQKAQDASEEGDYLLALAYYDAFRAEFPNDRDHNLWATYETAFLQYKLEKYDTALEMINGLLDRYAKETDLPQAPKVLAEKVKAKIIESQAKRAPAPAPAPKQ